MFVKNDFICKQIIEFCQSPKTIREICDHFSTYRKELTDGTDYNDSEYEWLMSLNIQELCFKDSVRKYVSKRRDDNKRTKREFLYRTVKQEEKKNDKEKYRWYICDECDRNCITFTKGRMDNVVCLHNHCDEILGEDGFEEMSNEKALGIINKIVLEKPNQISLKDYK